MDDYEDPENGEVEETRGTGAGAVRSSSFRGGAEGLVRDDPRGAGQGSGGDGRRPAGAGVATAEGEGFEPPKACTLVVFKTTAIDHSAIPPAIINDTGGSGEKSLADKAADRVAAAAPMASRRHQFGL